MADSNPPYRWSFHTHSRFCDGEGELGEVAEAAIGLGLTDLGLSSHAPLPFETDWAMPVSRLDEYVSDVAATRRRWGRDLNLWLGAEIDYIPREDVLTFQEQVTHSAPFEYFVGSVHFLGNGAKLSAFDGAEDEFNRILQQSYHGEIQNMVEEYYRRISRAGSIPKVAIIGHFDVIKRWNGSKRYFRGDEPWYVAAVEGALAAIAAAGPAIELNTAGWRKGLGEPYPAPWILERCRDLRIPVTVSADAHRPGDLTWGYERAKALLDRRGIVAHQPSTFVAARSDE